MHEKGPLARPRLPRPPLSSWNPSDLNRDCGRGGWPRVFRLAELGHANPSNQINPSIRPTRRGSYARSPEELCMAWLLPYSFEVGALNNSSCFDARLRRVPHQISYSEEPFQLSRWDLCVMKAARDVMQKYLKQLPS